MCPKMKVKSVGPVSRPPSLVRSWPYLLLSVDSRGDSTGQRCPSDVHAGSWFVPARYNVVPRSYTQEAGLSRHGTTLSFGFTRRKLVRPASDGRPLYYYLIKSEGQKPTPAAARGHQQAQQNFNPRFGGPVVLVGLLVSGSASRVVFRLVCFVSFVSKHVGF